MNITFIKKLTLMTTVGIHEWEHNRPQKIEIDVKMSRRRDLPVDREVAPYVDYAEASRIITSVVEDERFELLESMAERIAESLMTRLALSYVELQICKPAAVPQAENVGILVRKTRDLGDSILDVADRRSRSRRPKE